jgi:SulP family sulfate permease
MYAVLHPPNFAAQVHALTLLAILLVAAPLARFVPLATPAAVLFVVAYNMGEWREIGTIFRLSRLILPFGSPRLL